MSRWLQVWLYGHRDRAEGTQGPPGENRSSLETWQRVPDRDCTIAPKDVALSVTAKCCTTQLWKNALFFPDHPQLPSLQPQHRACPSVAASVVFVHLRYLAIL